MSEQNKLGPHAADYKEWLKELKTRVRSVQLKAAVAVNQELLSFYWELGTAIVERQKSAAWGSGFSRAAQQGSEGGIPGHEGVFV